MRASPIPKELNKLVSKYARSPPGVIDGFISVKDSYQPTTSKVIYRKGKQHGLYLRLSSEGRIREKGYYKNGKRHGLLQIFDWNGNEEII